MMFRRNKGSQTIEFALILLPLMMLVLVGFELVRLCGYMVFNGGIVSDSEPEPFTFAYRREKNARAFAVPFIEFG